jgi:FMN phosphatase YigB (HAD superfamily)
MTQRCVLFDIDGTLADATHREPLLGASPGPEQWAAFFNAMWDDPLIEPVAALYRAVWTVERVIVSSARPESHRGMTLDWFARHDLPVGLVMLRPPGDTREDFQVKRDALVRVQEMGLAPRYAVDDKPAVVAMYRSNGIVCLQAGPGTNR